MAALSARALLDRLRVSEATITLVEIDGRPILDVRGESARPLIDELRAHRDEIIAWLTDPTSLSEAESNLIAAFGEVEIVDDERRILARSIQSIVETRRRFREQGASLPLTVFLIVECPDCKGLSITTRRRGDLERRCPHCPGWKGRDDDPLRGKRRHVVEVVFDESDYSRPLA